MLRSLKKQKFYKISHSLHGDKLSHFLKTKPSFNSSTTKKQIQYIKQFSKLYQELTNIYSSKDQGLNLFNTISKMLESKMSVSELIDSVNKEIIHSRFTNIEQCYNVSKSDSNLQKKLLLLSRQIIKG